MKNGKRPLPATIPAPGKRRRLANRSTLQSYIVHCGIRYRVFGFLNPNHMLFMAPMEVIQDLMRGLMDRIRYRWERHLPIGVLSTTTVTVVDNTVMILAEGDGPENTDYQGKTVSIFVSVFGNFNMWSDRDQSLCLLRTPNLTLEQYDALYFHKFLQKGEQRAYWIPSCVERLKHQKVHYQGQFVSWEDAFDDWERTLFPEKINILKAAQKDPWALQVYKYRRYANTPSERLKFVRNLWVHLNDYRVKAGFPKYSILEFGELIEELFPGLINRLFRFFWEQHLIDLDFFKFRSYFQLPYLSGQSILNEVGALEASIMN